MFDVYMHAHAIDPRARRKMMAFMSVAVIATTVSLGSALVGERLGIQRVGAPKVEGLLVLPADQVPAPLVSPPPDGGKPVDSAAAVTVDPETPPERDHKPTVERDLAPIESDHARDDAGSGPGPSVLGPTNPIGPVCASCLPCAVPGTCARVPPTTAKPPTPAPQKPAFESIDVVRARAKHAPDPPHDQLARTPAGIAGKSGTSRVRFCVGTDGKTIDVRTKTSAGDGEVDRICRETVGRWRFEPMRVDDAARVTCSEVTFQIAFE